MRIVLVFLYLTFHLCAISNWQVEPCVVPDGKILEYSYSANDNKSATCGSVYIESVASHIGKKYSCSYNKQYVNNGWSEVSSCNADGSYSVYRLTTVYDAYDYINGTPKVCGDNSLVNTYNECVCTSNDMIFNESTNSCSCPDGKVYNGDFCESQCVALKSPYIQAQSISQNECSVSALQSLYDANNNDNRTITETKWHCDNLCYFVFDSTQQDNNSSYQDTNNSVDTGTIIYSFDTPTTTTNNVPGVTVVFDDSRIVKAINENRDRLDNLAYMNHDTIDTQTSHFDSFGQTIDDFTSLYDDLETSFNDIKSSMTTVYNPTFEQHNTCNYVFTIFTINLSFDLCKYASIIRPYIVFILTIYFLVLVARLHIYFISILVTRYG